MPGIADARVKQVQAWCNWIYLAHDLPSDCASAWYAIATETHDRDKYWTNSEKVMQKYIEMLTPLGNTTAGSAPEWAGQGVHADLETRKQDPEWIAGASNKYFSDHFGGVK
jgi:hypothetical protein